jgi:hypothetical protein
MYDRAVSIINGVNIILLDGESVSFDANQVTYKNSTIISPIIIMNRISGLYDRAS